MPYLPFPDDWPIYTPKDKLGDWLEAYVKIMELNYWTASTCQSAAYDDTTGEWAVTIMRDGALVTLRPKHIVLATGMSGVPIMPELTGTDKFKGKIVHSSEHIGGEGYQGKKCVIIGSNNSAHDICADLWEHGADVTMVQRSSTLVAKSDTLFKLGSSKLYSEEALEKGITTDIADMISASRPYRILTELSKPTCIELQKHDQDFYERLKKAGFILDFGEDGSGLFMKYIRRGSGYYIDVGASELIANGDVKLQTGQVAGLSETSILMEDGSVLESDLIVCATGYGSMNGWAAKLISKDVANKVGKVWGIGSGTTNDPGPWEGELRNIWKPTQQDGLWFHGGNLAQSRFYSQFLALQIKARAVDISTPVYALQESYHRN
jgi:putative flavoprotein involved in K+ transport